MSAASIILVDGSFVQYAKIDPYILSAFRLEMSANFESLTIMRDAIAAAISRLEAVPENDENYEFAIKECKYLQGVVTQIEADILSLHKSP